MTAEETEEATEEDKVGGRKEASGEERSVRTGALSHNSAVQP